MLQLIGVTGDSLLQASVERLNIHSGTVKLIDAILTAIRRCLIVLSKYATLRIGEASLSKLVKQEFLLSSGLGPPNR